MARSDTMANPADCNHEWTMIESRLLHDVEPRTIIRRYMCTFCHATKETEHRDE